MRINLIEWHGGSDPTVSSFRIRYKLAEIIAVNTLHAIQTSKYPPKKLTTEFFNDMKKEEKDFLEAYWTTFDLFKPDFTIDNEIPCYNGFVLYEVKSKVITEKNKNEIDLPEFKFSFNQKKCFEKCAEMGIPLRIFAVFFLDSWNIEVKQFDYSEVKKVFNRNSAWHEEKMKRIKSSKLNQFFNDLYPEYVLYRVDDEELERQDVADSEEYVSTIMKDPDEHQKRLITERMLKRALKYPHLYNPRPLHKVTERKRIKTIFRRGLRTTVNNQTPNNFGGVPKKYDLGVTFDEVRKNYPHAYEKWTSDEDTKLKQEFIKGKSINEIAKIHNRKHGGIKSRLKKLKLID